MTTTNKTTLAANHFAACMDLADAEALMGSFQAVMNASMRCGSAFPEGSAERAMFLDRYARGSSGYKEAFKKAEKARAEADRTFAALSGMEAPKAEKPAPKAKPAPAPKTEKPAPAAPVLTVVRSEPVPAPAPAPTEASPYSALAAALGGRRRK